MSDVRVVFDTNVVLDMLHFDDAVARPLLHALDTGRLRCVVTGTTLDEWRRVLTYPAFALDSARQAALVARYQALALFEPAAAPAELPRCRDPDDQKFIELAATTHAQRLVSKDRAVLRLRRRCAPRFLIMRPVEAVRWLASVSA